MSPEATWASKQHRLRWVLPEIAAGDRGDLRAQFLPDTKSDPLASAGVLEGAAGPSSSPVRCQRLLVPCGRGCGERAAGSLLLCKQALSGASIQSRGHEHNQKHQDPE